MKKLNKSIILALSLAVSSISGVAMAQSSNDSVVNLKREPVSAERLENIKGPLSRGLCFYKGIGYSLGDMSTQEQGLPYACAKIGNAASWVEVKTNYLENVSEERRHIRNVHREERRDRMNRHEDSRRRHQEVIRQSSNRKGMHNTNENMRRPSNSEIIENYSHRNKGRE